MDLKTFRVKNKLTQGTVAVEMGVSLMTVQLWERGLMSPSAENQKKLEEYIKKINEKNKTISEK